MSVSGVSHFCHGCRLGLATERIVWWVFPCCVSGGLRGVLSVTLGWRATSPTPSKKRRRGGQIGPGRRSRGTALSADLACLRAGRHSRHGGPSPPAPWSMVSAFAGLRLSEIRGLRWDDYTGTDFARLALRLAHYIRCGGR